MNHRVGRVSQISKVDNISAIFNFSIRADNRRCIAVEIFIFAEEFFEKSFILFRLIDIPAESNHQIFETFAIRFFEIDFLSLLQIYGHSNISSIEKFFETPRDFLKAELHKLFFERSSIDLRKSLGKSLKLQMDLVQRFHIQTRRESMYRCFDLPQFL